MARCVSCGADIVWRDTPEGERIPLDTHEQMRGPNRFADTADGLKPVTETASVLARVDHRKTCPYDSRGRRR